MKKILFITAVFCTLLIGSNRAAADDCVALGYTKTLADCPGKALRCPSNPAKVYCNPCGDGRGYRFDSSNCDSMAGLYPAGIECGGKWTECRECDDTFRYNASNCRSPKVLSGGRCGNSYEKCACPSGYVPKCTAGTKCTGTQNACGCNGTCVSISSSVYELRFAMLKGGLLS